MLFGQLGLLVGGKGEVKKQYWKTNYNIANLVMLTIQKSTKFLTYSRDETST